MLVLLPGMDGTGTLFEPLLAVLPKTCQIKVINYPTDASLTYEELERYVIERLPVGSPLIVIAESFSGPIALRLAARAHQDLRAVVVVSSFASRPFGWLGILLACLPLGLILRLPIPDLVLRGLLLGPDASDEMIRRTRAAIKSVRPNVLAFRLRQALTSKYCVGPIRCTVPVIALVSTHDRLLGARGHRSIAEACRGAQLMTIPAPHFAL